MCQSRIFLITLVLIIKCYKKNGINGVLRLCCPDDVTCPKYQGLFLGYLRSTFVKQEEEELHLPSLFIPCVYIHINGPQKMNCKICDFQVLILIELINAREMSL